jgi:biotin carboxyl carrier protein
MTYLVNGEAVELPASSAEVTASGDRLFVRTSEGTFSAIVVTVGTATWISFRGQQYRIEPFVKARAIHAAADSGELRSSMPGLVVDVRATVGQSIQKGETVVVVEAMKTQQPFLAPFDGTVAEIRVQKGDQVAENAVLAIVTP